MTKNRTPTLVYLDPGMHPGLEVKGLNMSRGLVDKKTLNLNLLFCINYYFESKCLLKPLFV